MKFRILLALTTLISLSACNGVFEVGIEHSPNGTATESVTPNLRFVETVVAATLSATRPSTVQPVPTETPALAPSNIPTFTLIGGWEKYIDPKYGFSFQHPPMDQTCCGISGPMTGNGEEIITLADKGTVLPNADVPFDGFALFVVPKSQNLSLQQYVEQEKIAQMEAGKIIEGDSFTPSGSDSTVTIGGQTGITIKGYSWDSNLRIYVPFPDGKLFLVMAVVEKSPGSFEQTLSQIISSFRFAE